MLFSNTIIFLHTFLSFLFFLFFTPIRLSPSLHVLYGHGIIEDGKVKFCTVEDSDSGVLCGLCNGIDNIFVCRFFRDVKLAKRRTRLDNTQNERCRIPIGDWADYVKVLQINDCFLCMQNDRSTRVGVHVSTQQIQCR